MKTLLKATLTSVVLLTLAACGEQSTEEKLVAANQVPAIEVSFSNDGKPGYIVTDVEQKVARKIITGFVNGHGHFYNTLRNEFDMQKSVAIIRGVKFLEGKSYANGLVLKGYNFSSVEFDVIGGKFITTKVVKNKAKISETKEYWKGKKDYKFNADQALDSFFALSTYQYSGDIKKIIERANAKTITVAEKLELERIAKAKAEKKEAEMRANVAKIQAKRKALLAESQARLDARRAAQKAATAKWQAERDAKLALQAKKDAEFQALLRRK